MYRYYKMTAIVILLNISAASAITRDSIGVENNNGKKVVIHKVVAKDTYYSIARRYSVNPKDVMTFNDSKYLQIGVIIKVPTTLPFIQANVSSSESNATSNLIEHTIQKKENLNMLAEKYGTTVNEIKRVNNLRSINLQIGQVLKIPAKAEFLGLPEKTSSAVENNSPAVPQPVIPTNLPKAVPPVVADTKELNKNIDLNAKPQLNPNEEELVVHTVASNETIYSIATRYKLTIDQLKAKNDLTSSTLSVGQKLLIRGQYPVKPIELPSAANSADTLGSIKDPSLRQPASRYGLNQIEEKGTAVWIADPDLDPSKMLVLHRSAPIGAIIKITNPMSNRSALAKVVGKFTENESTKDVIIVMTKAVADALGALDKRFYCNLIYGGQENEQ